MRLMLIAACGVSLAACGQAGNSVNEAAPAAEPGSIDEVAPNAVPDSAGNDMAGDSTVSDTAPQNVSACLVQDGERLRITPVKAIGTEPFWAATVEGRCVTYSTPEDQDGTRIWTSYNPGPDGGVWIGTLDGKPFKLITRLRQGCSDGMSDRLYPLEANLTVRGEERRGCAASDLESLGARP